MTRLMIFQLKLSLVTLLLKRNLNRVVLVGIIWIHRFTRIVLLCHPDPGNPSN